MNSEVLGIIEQLCREKGIDSGRSLREYMRSLSEVKVSCECEQ